MLPAPRKWSGTRRGHAAASDCRFSEARSRTIISPAKARSASSAARSSCCRRSSGQRKKNGRRIGRAWVSLVMAISARVDCRKIADRLRAAFALHTEIKMGHGGKRNGAGRKRKIARAHDRWRIGGLCEDEHRREALRQGKERLEHDPRQQKIKAALAR